MKIDVVRDKKPQTLEATLEKREPSELPRKRQGAKPI